MPLQATCPPRQILPWLVPLSTVVRMYTSTGVLRVALWAAPRVALWAAPRVALWAARADAPRAVRAGAEADTRLPAISKKPRYGGVFSCQHHFIHFAFHEYSYPQKRSE